MNITAINSTKPCITSINKNIQNSVKKSFITPLTNETPAKVTSETMRAYCPNISFKGNNGNTEIKSIQQKIIEELESIGKDDYTTAHQTAEKIPEVYYQITRILDSKSNMELLKLTDKRGLSVAHILANNSLEAYNKVTKDFKYKDRLALLKLSDNLRRTVAHFLVTKEYSKATEDFEYKDKIDLLNLTDGFGFTVANDLAGENPKEYVKTTEGLKTEDRFKLLKLTNGYYSTAHYLAMHSPKDFADAIQGLSDEQREELFTMRDYKGCTVYDYYLKNILNDPKCRDLKFQFEI